MSLFETSLLGKAKTGKFPVFDPFPEDFPEIVLQEFELHGLSLAPEFWEARHPDRGAVGSARGLRACGRLRFAQPPRVLGRRDARLRFAQACGVDQWVRPCTFAANFVWCKSGGRFSTAI